MNLLDFEMGFETWVTFEGDNETDANELVIKRDAIDNNGHVILVHEVYSMRRDSLEEIARGLETMLKNIREYLS